MSYLVGITRTEAGRAIADVNTLYGYPRYSTVVRDGSDGILMPTFSSWYQSSIDGALYAVTLRSVRLQYLRRAVNEERIDVATAQRLAGYFNVAVEALPEEYLNP